jgi:putative ABC transport system substrate-binding protein
MEWRFAEGDYRRFPEMAVDLVRADVDVIVASFTVAALAAQKATSSIPIILAYTTDPVGSGFVRSLSHPGGNITGLATYLPDLSAKHLELLSDFIPGLSRVVILMNTSNPGHRSMFLSTESEGKRRGIYVSSIDVRTEDDLDDEFKLMSENMVQAIIVQPDPLFNPPRTRVADLALKYRIASIHPYSDYPKIGGLMSYGQNVGPFFRRSAYFVDKIFKGANPADLPVEQPTKFELIISLKVARAIGLTVSPLLLARADEVIE